MVKKVAIVEMICIVYFYNIGGNYRVNGIVALTLISLNIL